MRSSVLRKLKFQVEIWNSSFVLGKHYMPIFSVKANQNDPVG